MTQKIQTPLRTTRGNVTLVDVLLQARRSMELGLSVSFPATVVRFQNPFVDVHMDFLAVLGTDDGEQVQEPVVLSRVPVRFEGQGAAGGGYLTVPILPGHKGQVVVSDRSLERWIERGESADPELRHTHSPIDGIFYPGLRDESRKISSVDPAAAVLEHEAIKLGAVAAEVAVRGLLDLDHVGAEVGEQDGGERSLLVAGEIEDTDSIERAWHESLR